MQKKIIALAVAGLVSGVAFAQSNVTIYGVMDAGFFSVGGNGERATGVQSSGMTTSRLGFKGEEDLGGGLKAVFNLETALDLDSAKSQSTTIGSATGDTIFGAARQANVGIVGAFGRVLVGTQPSLSDNWAGGVTEPMGNLSARNVINNTLGRFSNEKARATAYYSPIFSGLQLGAMYATKSEASNTTTTERQAYYQVGANYANGPIAAAVTFARLTDNISRAPQDWTVGASYDFGVAKVFAGYERSSKVDALSSVITSSATLTSTTRPDTNAQWTLGVRVPVTTAGTISASYAANKNDRVNQDAKGWQVGYDHALSKRTTAYAAYFGIDNESASQITPAKRYNGTTAFTAANGKDYNGFTVGVRHTF